MRDYFRGIWEARHFWMSLVRNDLRTRYRRSALGIGWSLVNPIAFTTVLCVVFHKMFDVKIEEYAPMVLCGLAFWNYFTVCVLQGCQSFFRAECYIRQHPRPMAIYPLRIVCGAGFHFLIALGVAVLVSLVWNGHFSLTALSTLFTTLILLFLFGWAMSILAGLMSVHFPDTPHICEVILQMLFYATPVMYTADMLKAKGLSWIIQCNPLSVFLELMRQPILTGTVPSMELFAMGCAVTAVSIVLAVFAMAKCERRLVFAL